MPNDGTQRLSTALPVRLSLWILTLAATAALLLSVLGRFSGVHIWDDAFIVGRYADNLLSEGRFEWNPGGPATYGLTSPLYLAAVVPLRLLIPHNVVAVLALSSMLSAAVFIMLLLRLVATPDDAPRGTGLALCALTLFNLALAGAQISQHVVSGMDTMFALAYLTAYILLARGLEHRPGRVRALWLGVMGGAAWFVRPDLVLYAAAVPAAMAFLARDPRARRLGRLSGILTLALIAAGLLGAYLVFGSALPLPFFAKTGSSYGPAIHQIYRRYPSIQFFQFAMYFCFPVFLIAADGLQGGFRGRDGRRSPLDMALLAATFAFWIYYLFFVLQVMGMGARFFYPTLPPLLFLGARSLVRILSRTGAFALQPRGIVATAVALLGFLFINALVPPARQGIEKALVREQAGDFGQFDLNTTVGAWGAFYWFRAREFSALPDDAVIAATEIGGHGALNPRKRIIDLSGLNDPAFARGGFSAERLFTKDRPDLLFMPHVDYREMTAAILDHPRFQSDYEYLSAPDLAQRIGLPVNSGIALRRDSPHFAQMEAIAFAGPRTR